MKHTSSMILTALFILFSAICFATNVFAQNPNSAWALHYGDDYSHAANSVAQTKDGGYIIAGSGYLITKLNPDGTVVWQKEYLFDFNDSPYSIEETQDGGFIVAGTSKMNYEDKVWILKLDSSGGTDWQKMMTYEENSDFKSRAYSVKETFDDAGNPEGYVIAGSTIHLANQSGIWVLKLDLEGTIDWQKTFNKGIAGAFSIEQTFDSDDNPDGFIIAGSNDYYGSHAWLLKLDQDGTLIWDRTYGGSSHSARSVKQTADGGFIVAGSGKDLYSRLAPGRHYWVVKLDQNRSVEWNKLYGGSNGEAVPFSVQEIVDEFGNPNGYVIAGETANFGAGGKDVWIIKIGPDGNIEWEKTYGGSFNESANSIQQTFDQFGNPSGYVVAGYTWSYGSSRDSFILKLNVNGEIPGCELMNNSAADVLDGDVVFYDNPPETKVENSFAYATATEATITEKNYQTESICSWEPTSIIEVSPMQISFGDVKLNESRSQVITIQNINGHILKIWYAGIYEGDVNSFNIIDPPSFPVSLDWNDKDMMEITITFEPASLGEFEATLSISSDDLVYPFIDVPLIGTGVAEETPSDEQIDMILDFINDSVNEGSFEGSGPGTSAENRLTALINMIEAAGDLIKNGDLAEACDQLMDAYKKCDGSPRPPDFVTGDSVEDLAKMINELMADIGCE